ITVTVESVGKGNAEQPVDFHLVETPGRAYRPSKTMRRVIVAAWGKESDTYPGRRMTLYRHPEVKFGGQKVGGIKISHLSHIDKSLSLSRIEIGGKPVLLTVSPLAEGPMAAPEPTEAEVAASTDVEALKGAWRAASPARRKQIEARVAELTTPAEATS